MYHNIKNKCWYERTFYHYAPNDVVVSIAEHGLLTLKGFRELGLSQEYSTTLDKYRSRAKQHKQQEDYTPTDEEVAQYLKELRGEGWDEYIYAFDKPIPEDAASRFKRFIKHNKLYKIQVPDDTELYNYLPTKPKDFSENPLDNILFADIPHYGVRVCSSVKPEADET